MGTLQEDARSWHDALREAARVDRIGAARPSRADGRHLHQPAPRSPVRIVCGFTRLMRRTPSASRASRLPGHGQALRRSPYLHGFTQVRKGSHALLTVIP